MKKILMAILISSFLYAGCNLNRSNKIISNSDMMPKGYHLINGIYPENCDSICLVLFNTIKYNWFQNDSLKCYFYDELVYNKILLNKNCFIGQSPDMVTNILGTPSRMDKSLLIYHLSKKCDFDYLPSTGYSISFGIKDGRVTRINKGIIVSTTD